MSLQYRTQDPSTGNVIATYQTITDEELEERLESASTTFSSWKTYSPTERAVAVQRCAELLAQQKNELSQIISQEMGKPLNEAQEEIDFCVDIFNYYAEHGPTQLADQSLQNSQGLDAVLQRRPLGILLGVMPWNYPFYQVARFAAPSLLAGNVILLKHAEQCAGSALAIQKIMDEAGVPAGVYQNVFANHDQIGRLIADSRVQGISLTGSERAGSAIAAQAGQYLKKVVLELGGSDPFVVLSSNNPRALARDALEIRLENTGQACNSNKRIIVMEDIYDEFVDELVKRVGHLVAGDPLKPDEGCFYPLSSENAAKTLLAQLDNAVQNGAKILVGGERLQRTGYFVSPAVLTDLAPGSTAYHQELFGPVVTVYKAATPEEALHLANDTPYGLGASVYAIDEQQARDFAHELEAGMVGVNAQAPETADLPFGGIKGSGYGRELGPLGIDEFVNKRLFHVNS